MNEIFLDTETMVYPLEKGHGVVIACIETKI